MFRLIPSVVDHTHRSPPTEAELTTAGYHIHALPEVFSSPSPAWILE